MNPKFTITGAYPWDSTNARAAMLKLNKMISNRLTAPKGKKFKYNINYRKLRASAGKSMLDSILTRIKSAQVLIFDLTDCNPNVMLELGCALAISRDKEYLSVYLIREKGAELPDGIPSDLHGYFVSEYIVERNGTLVFKDNGSLLMSIEGDVKEFFNQFIDFNQINENE